LRFVDSNVFIYILVKSPRDDYVIAKRMLQKQAYFDYKLRDIYPDTQLSCFID